MRRGALWLAALLLLGAGGAGAQVLKTRNVVLLVSDGLRWQEVFSGADPLLLNAEHGGIWDKEAQLRQRFWRADPQARRAALMPFLWGTVASHGQLFGNQARGSIARVTNGLAFSYPGYNEMLTGRADARINSNEYGPNPNLTVFEWLNGQPEFHGRVAAYATWAVFNDIFNVARSHLPVHAGWQPPYPGSTDPAQQLLNRLYATTIRFDEEDLYDAFMQVRLLQGLPHEQPRVLFVGYGETDDFAHAGRYDLVLRSAHAFDQFARELWEQMQALPAYRDQTTFILTADHGRGSGPVEWKEHGVEQQGSENIWIAVMGPDTPPRGEHAGAPELQQAQIAATIAALLGKDYRHAVPVAAAPIAAVLGTP